MEHVCPDSIRRYAAKIMLRQAGSDDIKEMPAYREGLEAAVTAGMTLLSADPAADQGKVQSAIVQAISAPLNTCRAEIVRRDKERRGREQQLNLERQAALEADQESQRPDAELVALLPGMPDATQALADQGLTTVRELLNLAEEKGMLNLNTLGLTPTDAQELVSALYTAAYDISRLTIAKPPTGQKPAADGGAKPANEPGPLPEPVAHDPEPAPKIDTPEKGVPTDSQTTPAAKPPKAPAQPAQPAADVPANRPPSTTETEDGTPRIVDEAGLPTRLIDTLADAGIQTRGQLIAYIQEHQTLDKLKGVGEKSVELIKGYLASLQTPSE